MKWALNGNGCECGEILGAWMVELFWRFLSTVSHIMSTCGILWSSCVRKSATSPIVYLLHAGTYKLLQGASMHTDLWVYTVAVDHDIHAATFLKTNLLTRNHDGYQMVINHHRYMCCLALVLFARSIHWELIPVLSIEAHATSHLTWRQVWQVWTESPMQYP